MGVVSVGARRLGSIVRRRASWVLSLSRTNCPILLVMVCLVRKVLLSLESSAPAEAVAEPSSPPAAAPEPVAPSVVIELLMATKVTLIETCLLERT